MGKLMVGWSWVFKTINRAEEGGGYVINQGERVVWIRNVTEVIGCQGALVGMEVS